MAQCLVVFRVEFDFIVKRWNADVLSFACSSSAISCDNYKIILGCQGISRAFPWPILVPKK